MVRRRTGLAITLAACLGALAAIAPAAHAGPTPPLGHEGRWITDARGRVVILHGWNMVYKLPPYQPAAAGFGRDDARFLARHGFNTVRLGIIYTGLEPRPGRINRRYLRQTMRTARILAEEGIFVLLDFHQDLYNERFQGEGFPDWAVLGDAQALPAEPKVGFPGNYLAMPALWRAFDHLWANDPAADGRGLQDALAAAWRRVAQRFRGRPMVLGYNLLNEPWPGSQWPTCVSPEGCPAFDLASLTPFSKRVIAGIRKADRRQLVWYAPNVTFDFGARSWHGDTGDPRAGFAFNMYCLQGDPLRTAGLDSFAELEERSCEVTYDRTLTLADEQSQATGDALLLTEFGATDRLETIEQVVEAADDQMVSWQQWAYWNADPSGETPNHGLIRDLGRPPRGENVKGRKLRASARPYPTAIAGTPLEFDFDRESRSLFELRYSTRRADGAGRFPPGSVTEVFLPRLHYPSGFDARVQGAHAVARTRAQTLRLVSRPGAKVIRLRLTRNGGRNRG